MEAPKSGIVTPILGTDFLARNSNATVRRFCASTVAAITVMGGTFAVLPAYEADLYGPKYVQAIHGRFLLAATLSTIIGPTLLLQLRSAAEMSAIHVSQ